MMSSLHASEKFLYDAMPLLDVSFREILVVYIERSSTGGNCLKSPNNIMDLPPNGTFLFSGKLYRNHVSICASIHQPTMLFSSIIT